MLRPMRPILRHPLNEDVLPVQDKPQSYWNSEQLEDDLLNCPEGLAAYQRAMDARGGEVPFIHAGTPHGGGTAVSDVETGEITLSPRLSRSGAAQSAIFELNNVASRDKFRAVKARAAAGELSREDYSRELHAVEFEGIPVVDKAFQSCGSKWGAPAGGKSIADNLLHAKTFDERYSMMTEVHKQNYRDIWDAEYKDAYEKAQNNSWLPSWLNPLGR